MNHREKNNHGMRHMIMMALACIIPLAIILVLPIFGVFSKWTIIGAMGLMVSLHVLTMKNHFKGGEK